jgi:diguanylate cyclase (GGDEF)-like protein/PAS domain S-box-containing protein
MAFKLPFAHYAPPGFDAILQQNTLGIAVTRNKTITRCNRVFEEMFGSANGGLIGLPTWRIFESEARYEEFATVARQRFRSKDEPFEINWCFPRGGGNDLMCRIRAQALESPASEEMTVWIFEDVGPALRQGEALEILINQLNAVVQNAPVGIIFTISRKVVKANPEFCKMFRYDQAAALTLSGRNLFPTDQIYADLGKTASPLLSQGKPLVCEMEMIRGDGELFWAQLVAYVVNPKVTDEGTIWMITDRSEVKQHEEAKRKAMLENQIILNSAVVGIIYLKNRMVEHCNPKAEQIFCCPPGGLVGTSTRAWYQSDADFQRVAEETYPAIVGGSTYTLEQTMLRMDGTPFWCRMAGQVLDPENPISGPSIWVVEDITERHAAEQDLVKTKALMQAVFDSAKVSIIVTDADGIVRMMNQTASSWLGYEVADIVGQVTPRVFHDVDEVIAYSKTLTEELGIEVVPGFDTFVVRARMFGSDDHEWSYIRRDGSRFQVHLTTSVLRDSLGAITGYIGVGIDMTDRNRADNAMRVAQMHLEERVIIRTAELATSNLKLQEEMAQRQVIEEKMLVMAHYDGLTGLPNRNLLLGRLEKAIAVARRRSSPVGLMFIDLDRFKWVNDTLGHHAGDVLLQEVTRRMSKVIRDTDTLARHGGDEFVLLVPEVAHRQELVELAGRLVDVFSTPFEISSQFIETTASIGIASYPDDCSDPDILLRCADSAMYQAKIAGKNQYKFFCELADEN